MQKSALVAAGLLTASVAHAAPIPDAVAAMLGAAAGDAAQLQVIADTAKKANPRSATEIDAKFLE